MSDTWQVFLRREDDGVLYILTDVGIVDEIDAVAPAVLVRIDLPVKSEDGFPDDDEDDALHDVEDHVIPALEELGSIYVGRITRAGMRSLYLYADIAEEAVEKLTVEVETRFGIKAGTYIGGDPEHRVYKSMLYPTREEWSVIHDIGVFEQLAQNGDERETPREVMHFAYFPDRTAAEAFAAHVEGAGFRLVEVGTRPAKEGVERASERMCVRFAREDIPAYGDFTSVNIELRRAARECGGEYDGWETAVVRTLQ